MDNLIHNVILGVVIGAIVLVLVPETRKNNFLLVVITMVVGTILHIAINH